MNDIELDHKIKEVIINKLNLDHIKIEDIDSEAPLFNDGLGLDSIDALELGLGIKDAFNVKIKSEENINEHFYSVQSIRNFIKNKNEELR